MTMKILVICHEHPPVGGGAGMAASNIAQNLALLGHKVSLVTSLFGRQEQREFLNGYEIFRIDMGRRRDFGSSVWEWIKFMVKGISFTSSLIRDDKPDYIFAFFTLPAGFIAVNMKKKFNIPVLTSVRGQDVPGFCPKEFRVHHFFASPLFQAVWKRSNVVVVQSKKQYEKLKKYDVKRLFRSANGVNTGFFKPEKSRKDRAKSTILYAGRLTVQKNILWLIQRFYDLNKSSQRNTELVIVGEGPEKNKIIDLVSRMSLQAKVSLYPWCSRNDMLKWYQAADIYVLPSLDEGMPNSVTEAMACGLPVIATRVCGTEELIEPGKDGFLFEVNDSLGFMEYLIRLIDNDSLRLQIGDNARLKALRRSWMEVTLDYLTCTN